jgi:hypothetical protein
MLSQPKRDGGIDRHNLSAYYRARGLIGCYGPRLGATHCPEDDRSNNNHFGQRHARFLKRVMMRPSYAVWLAIRGSNIAQVVRRGGPSTAHDEVNWHYL